MDAITKKDFKKDLTIEGVLSQGPQKESRTESMNKNLSNY